MSNLVLNAYYAIERGRTYSSGQLPVALPLSSRDIESYISIFDTPCEIDLFTECIFAIDLIFLEDSHQKIKPSK